MRTPGVLAGVTIAFACGAVVASIRAQTPVQPLPVLWELPTRGNLPQAIVIDGRDPRYLYVAEKNGGVSVLRLNGPRVAPVVVAAVPRAALDRLDAMNLALRGDRLYVALGDFFGSGSSAGFAIVDVSSPERPKLLSIWESPASLKGAAAIVADDRTAYLGAMTQGVMVFDITTPSSSRLLTTFLPDVNFPYPNPTAVQHPNARGLTLVGDRLYVADDAGGLRIVDVSTPARPRELGRYVNAGMRAKQQAYNNLEVDGRYAFAAIDYAGLEVLDVSNPAAIRQVAWWNPWKADSAANVWLNSPGHTNQIVLDRASRLAYLSGGDSELLVVDVSDPARPALVARHGEPKDGRGAWGLALGDSAVYLADITAIVPFRGTWAGIVAVERPQGR